MAEKRKVLFFSDHPLVPSGVGTQSKYLIEGLLATGRYQFICAGGAIQHPDYTPQRIQPDLYGDDWIVYPVNGYGDKNFVRQMLVQHRPDAIVIFTDPRFFVWLLEMEDEIHTVCPILYWHVWDNDPAPEYNRSYYESTDFIGALSLKTYGLLQKLGFDRSRFSYIPHALPAELFKPLPELECETFRREKFGPHRDKKFFVFWNNRNARRKQTGDVIGAFAKFSGRVGHENCALVMHTNVGDPEGQDVLAVAKCYGLENLIISEDRVPPEELNRFYNACDVTINIASNEGFGLGTLESIFAGTPVVAHMTGGLQFQLGDWWEDLTDFSDQDRMTSLASRRWYKQHGLWTGVPVFSASRSCTGSQQIPYIYDDRVHHDDVVRALERLYEMGRTRRRALGAAAREWATTRFDLTKMVQSWDLAIGEQVGKFQQRGPARPRLATI
jgi:glycosyltransferase involved in cell wall biosynthesis